MQDKKVKQIIAQAVDVLRLEAESIVQLADRVDENFARMVDLICKCKGRVIIAGIGKSGSIARKIVATLNSTGTRALFLHPVEAMHGDLGMVDADDIFLALSASGATDELNIILPSILKIGCPTIGFTGNRNSPLARHCQIVIDVGVEKEACPMGLAPTCSTTAMLAMGDALAVALINQKQFKSDDFKRVHPGGALGQRLSGRINDLMLTGTAMPLIAKGATMTDALAGINHYGLGVILVTSGDKRLAGIITDGDIRRAVAAQQPLATMTVDQVMSVHPRCGHPDDPVYDALNTMERHQIMVLPITDADKNIKGILHLHDILGKGEFKFNGQ